MKDAPKTWIANPKMVDAVNLCMEMLCKVGLTEIKAEYAPACLDQAIKASNLISMEKTAFSPAKIEVKEENGGYNITPWELRTLFFQ